MQRISIFILALIGMCVAAYLAAYQMGAVARVWDPLFGIGSERVLDSNLSRAMRRITVIPDSALGAIAYLTEIVLALIASPKRRWAMTLFALNSLALVVAGATLVALQAFVVHAWCLLCLTSAAISFAIAGIAGRDVHQLFPSKRT